MYVFRKIEWDHGEKLTQWRGPNSTFSTEGFLKCSVLSIWLATPKLSPVFPLYLLLHGIIAFNFLNSRSSDIISYSALSPSHVLFLYATRVHTNVETFSHVLIEYISGPPSKHQLWVYHYVRFFSNFTWIFQSRTNLLFQSWKILYVDFSRAAVTKYSMLGGLNNWYLFPQFQRHEVQHPNSCSLFQSLNSHCVFGDRAYKEEIRTQAAQKLRDPVRTQWV